MVGCVVGCQMGFLGFDVVFCLVVGVVDFFVQVMVVVGQVGDDELGIVFLWFDFDVGNDVFDLVLIGCGMMEGFELLDFVVSWVGIKVCLGVGFQIGDMVVQGFGWGNVEVVVDVVGVVLGQDFGGVVVIVVVQQDLCVWLMIVDFLQQLVQLGVDFVVCWLFCGL